MSRTAIRLSELPSLESLPADGLLVVEEAAAYLGVAPSTLEKWRVGIRGIHGGPPFHRLHDGPKSPVRYRVDDLRNWLAKQRVDPRDNPPPGGQTPAHAA